MPSTVYTGTTLVTAVQSELQDDAGEYFTVAKVLARANDTIAAFLRETRIRRATGTIDIVGSTAVYSLSSLSPRCIDVLRMALPSSAGATDEIELTYLSQEDIERQDPNWRITTGWPFAYTRFGEGLQSVRLYPIPDSSDAATVQGGLFATSPYGIVTNINGLAGTQATSAYGVTSNVNFIVGALRVDYVAGGTDITGANSLETVAGIPPEYQDAIFNGTCARCCEMDVEIAQVQKSPMYWAKYQEAAARAASLALKGMQSKPVRNTVVRTYR